MMALVGRLEVLGEARFKVRIEACLNVIGAMRRFEGNVTPRLDA
jgi:hypothetical protein